MKPPSLSWNRFHQRYAIDAETSKEKWIFQTNKGCGSSPAVTSSGDIAFIGCDNGIMYAVNTEKGTQRWSVGTNNFIRSQAAITKNDQWVYFTGFDGMLRAHSVQDGSKKWVANFQGSLQRIYSAPVISKDEKVIFYASYDKMLYAVHAATGVLKWKTVTGTGVVRSPPPSHTHASEYPRGDVVVRARARAGGRSDAPVQLQAGCHSRPK